MRSAKDLGIALSMSDDERRAQRTVLATKERARIAALTPKEKWSRFLDETCGHEEVWTAFAPDDRPGGWYDKEHGRDVVCVWSNEDLAVDFLSDREHGWNVYPVPITDWINDVAPELAKLDFWVVVDFTAFDSYRVVEPEALCEEWSYTWRTFAKSLRK